MKNRCKHTSGWFVRDVMLVVRNDELTLRSNSPRSGSGVNKAVLTCNVIGCGATRNLYLTEADFTFGKVRPAPQEGE